MLSSLSASYCFSLKPSATVWPLLCRDMTRKKENLKHSLVLHETVIVTIIYGKLEHIFFLFLIIAFLFHRNAYENHLPRNLVPWYGQ